MNADLKHQPSGEKLHFRPLHSGLGFRPISESPAISPITPDFSLPRRRSANSVTRPAPSAPRPLIRFYRARRVLAYFFDLGLNCALAMSSILLALYSLSISFQILKDPSTVAPLFFYVMFFHWALLTAQEVALHSSAGKALMGLRLSDGGPSAIFLRSFFFPASVCFGGLGIFWGLFDSQGRCWHDLAVDIHPIPVKQ